MEFNKFEDSEIREIIPHDNNPIITERTNINTIIALVLLFHLKCFMQNLIIGSIINDKINATKNGI